MKTLSPYLFVLLIFSLFSSCNRDKSIEPPKPTPYYVMLTDTPGPYTAVNIDLRSVEVTGNGGGAVTLNTTPGIYNLLDLANGVDTLIATGSLSTSQVQQIRLILGPNNSVVVGGTTYPLATPSAQQSGLKLQVHQQLQPGIAYYVLLDFDANQSIVNEGNGSYSLKPVIRTIETALSGSIQGRISPAGVATTITATSGGVSYSSVANANGDFVIAGLPAGTYTVSILPASPHAPVTLSNVVVTTGSVTNVGVVNI